MLKLWKGFLVGIGLSWAGLGVAVIFGYDLHIYSIAIACFMSAALTFKMVGEW